MIVPSGTPGTLKTVEQVMDQQSETSTPVKNVPMKSVGDQVESSGDEQKMGVVPKQKTPVLGGEK